MYGSQPYKQFMVFIITFFLLSITGFTYFTDSCQSEASSSSAIDQGDGFYQSKKFTEIPSQNLHNTIKSDGKITLDPEGNTDVIHNFSNWSNTTDHRAYTYNPFISFLEFYPPSIHINREQQLTTSSDYNKIAEKDSITYPTLGSGSGTSRQQVHHFRFKIEQDAESITKLGIYWHGKAENDLNITLYYWQAFNLGSLGLWQQADQRISNDSFVSLHQNYTGDLFIDTNGYVDICVVATPEYGEKCKLFTDYVSVTTQGRGYALKGHVKSIEVSPTTIDRWQQFSWNDYEKNQTTIKYHLFYENETGYPTYVEEQYVPGNQDGLSTSPVDISNIPTSYNLSIQANLTTNDLLFSPVIYNWGLTWQIENNRWQDHLNSSLRIDEEFTENINIKAGRADLIPVLNHWPMFAGPTSSNTRANTGIGPDSNHSDLTWYSAVNGGGKQKNPVVKNAVLYVASQDGTKLYSFDAQATTGSTVFNPVKSHSLIPNHIMKNTPVVTDKYVVVATGSSAKGGGIANTIYGFDHELGETPVWSFDYGSVHNENPFISYASSPVYAGNNIYISTWSGDDSILNSVWNLVNYSRGNNLLLALNEEGNLEWEYQLPTGSFCSPAVKDDLVIVGCERMYGDSIFAVNIDGEEQWSRNVGPIGYASPVISNNIVIVIAKQPSMIPVTANSVVYALQLNNGEILWNASIGDTTVDPYQYAGFNTPAVADDIVYVASPDGKLHAFNIENGEELWKKTVYDKKLLSTDYLLSSPGYTDGIIYIGTPDGTLFGIDAETNETLWTEDTMDESGVISSPVIVDGLLYYIEQEGIIQCRGELQFPPGEQTAGSMMSIPIHQPTDESYTWSRFYTTYSQSNGDITFHITDEDGDNILLSDIENGESISTETVNTHDIIRLKAEFSANANAQVELLEWSVTYISDGGDENITVFYEDSFTSSDIPPNCSIDVRNQNIGLWNTSAAYLLQYENESGEQTTAWIPTNCTGINGSTNRETITANLSELNFTENITQYEQIRFKIKDTNGDETFSEWHTFPHIIPPDEAKPAFDETTFNPSDEWVTSPQPTCTIRVQDKGTDENISGLNVSSATFTLNYTDNTGSHTDIFAATCTGVNGTTSVQTITATVANVENSDNFTNVSHIQFSIADMAGNQNTSSWFNLTIDDEKPYSQISNIASIPAVTNTSPVAIEATANDNLSGVAEVTLYYRLTTATQWSSFDSDSNAPYEWEFTIGSNDGGEYELCSVATDNAGNEEAFPPQRDVTFLYDPNPPNKPSFADEYRFTDESIPEFNDVTFTDDYQLNKVEYRLNFEGLNEWTRINEQDLSTDSYTPTWNLKAAQWNEMQEDETYYLYFRVTDLLGNSYQTPSQNAALHLIKDLENATPYDPDLSEFDQWHWNNEYTIRVNVNETTINSVQLWYQYSSDNETWSNWSQYGDNLTAAPFEWLFNVQNGTGYYSFKTEVLTSQGAEITSEQQTVYVIIFPLLELILLTILVIILFVVTILLFQKRKQKKQKT